MGEPGFWEDDGRVAVLGGIELRDRIESGLRSAGSLLNRIRSARRPPAELVRRAAQRRAPARRGARRAGGGRARRRHPARRRRPRVRARASSPCTAPGPASAACGWKAPRSAANRRFRWQATVTGFGALRTLRPESGLHVLEIPDGRGGYDRRRVRVTVTPEAPGTARRRAQIVRRYREHPTPLVRDAVRGWRTGRLDAVLAGGFDLVE